MAKEGNAISQWENEVGRQIRDLRIRQNISQEMTAAGADVSLSAIKNLENGNGCNIKTLIAVLIYLGKEQWLGTITEYDNGKIDPADPDNNKKRAYNRKRRYNKT